MRKKLFAGIMTILFVIVGAFIAWAAVPAAPMTEALAAMESSPPVSAAKGDWLVFQPQGQQPAAGLIFYPGGRVDPRAYAPYARSVAEAGYLVVIVPMPFNLAVTAPDRAREVIARYPGVQSWVIGGHSLGGAMAARYAQLNPDGIDGLILLASYPAENNDLSDSALPVLSIYGTLDGLASREKIATSAALLPGDTVFYPVEGGNHAQFGWYGEQAGDQPARISREEQQRQAVQVTVEFLKQAAAEVALR